MLRLTHFINKNMLEDMDMSFDDLTFGWHKESYELSDVQITSSIELHQKDNDGDLILRDPPWTALLSDEERDKKNSEYENIDESEVAYSNNERILTANASFDNDRFNQLLLGIPENKEHTHSLEYQEKHFKLYIKETLENDLVGMIKSGEFRYLEYDSEMRIGGYAYARFYVASSMFDEIESLLTQPNIGLNVTLSRKGWYWLGPIGDTTVYLNKDGRDKAELSGITSTRNITKVEKNELLDEEQDELWDVTPGAVKENVHILRKLSELGGSITSIKSAVWIIALTLIYIAYSSFS